MVKVVVIAGVSASGKSRLAVQLAKRFKGEIISADAYQVYKGMDIGTNKISKLKMEGIEHHLLDCVRIDETWDVSIFQQKAREVIDQVIERGRLPIVCGGTGFYVSALIKDYRFLSLPQKADYSAFSDEQLRQMLLRVDENEALKIDGNNRRRLEKALDFFASNGIKKSVHDANSNKPFYDALIIFLDPPRDKVAQIVKARTQQMFEDGWKEEVAGLVKNFPNFKDTVAAKAIGYQQIAAGNYDVEPICQQIIEYGRKQRTWFVNKPNDKTLVINDFYNEQTLQVSASAVQAFLEATPSIHHAA